MTSRRPMALSSLQFEKTFARKKLQSEAFCILNIQTVNFRILVLKDSGEDKCPH